MPFSNTESTPLVEEVTPTIYSRLVIASEEKGKEEGERDGGRQPRSRTGGQKRTRERWRTTERKDNREEREDRQEKGKEGGRTDRREVVVYRTSLKFTRRVVTFFQQSETEIYCSVHF